MLKIAMLSTGEEVLHGDIVDTNASWLSELFFQQGFPLTKRSTVGDTFNGLVEELLMLSFNCDVVIVNGGLGPTSDDLSTEAAAAAAEVELELSPLWLERLHQFFASRNMSMPESNRKQAMLPTGSTLIDNPIGTACGFKMQINDCLFYFTPGVPSEFKRMVSEQIVPDLQRRYTNVEGLDCAKIYTFGTSESGLSDKLDKLQLPQGYQLGYRSYLPYIEVKLFGPKGDLETRLKLMQLIFKLIEPNVVSIDQPMASHVGQLIGERKLSISLAERSTNGSLANWLHSNPQAREYCAHGWVLGGKVNVGDNDADILAETLALAGATQDKCVTDIAIVSGRLVDNSFAVAVATPEGEWGQVLTFNRRFTPEDQQTLITTVCADMLRRYLSNKPMFANYSSLKREKEIHVPSRLLG
ncbi:CinA family nicotinamide mononucleotide deamidase-related protein [Vibrio ponticus]|uniref:CinA-like protein n=1 Tax=Vibrio ponticus TaxID=265668 RepID=A0A3N3DX79_9VIBR|nr:CinA family nicotinamide mononucleotide deamidase-related protein [Vibrio ponticus]ROV58979.1 CinA family nicotinamide mononucleotide deamidase-related protein [Vibrio ponticus]